jgi:2-keto-3-deoxy-L-rhamnonate aldolase RhmA
MNLAGKLLAKAKDDVVIGTTVTMSDLAVTEALGLAGLDFVWVDMEHTALGKAEVCGHLIAAKAAQIASCVRVPWNDPVQIKPILDMGPDALIVPQIRTLSDAKAAIAACLYPPRGVRGFGPLRASGYGAYNVTKGMSEDYKPTLLFLQIEHIDCVRCLDEILELDGVDGLIVGPMDLSASIGKLGQLEDAELNAIFDALANKVVKAGKMLGVSMAYVPERITAWIARGASFLSLAQDVEILIASLRQIVDTTEKKWRAASVRPMEKRPPRLRGLGADQP